MGSSPQYQTFVCSSGVMPSSARPVMIDSASAISRKRFSDAGKPDSLRKELALVMAAVEPSPEWNLRRVDPDEGRGFDDQRLGIFSVAARGHSGLGGWRGLWQSMHVQLGELLLRAHGAPSFRVSFRS